MKKCENCRHWIDITSEPNEFEKETGIEANPYGICTMIMAPFRSYEQKIAAISDRKGFSNLLTKPNFLCKLYGRKSGCKNPTIEKYLSIVRLHSYTKQSPFMSMLDKASDLLTKQKSYGKGK